MASFPARHLTNVIWGVAKLSSLCKLARHVVVSEPAVVALNAAVGAAVRGGRLADFNARDLSNTAWAFLTLGRFDLPTMQAIARRAARVLDTFNAQETSKLLCAAPQLMPTPCRHRGADRTVHPTLASRRQLGRYAMAKAGVSCPELEAGAAAHRQHTFDFTPGCGPPIVLTHILGGGRARGGREETGATAATVRAPSNALAHPPAAPAGRAPPRAPLAAELNTNLMS